jgi:hypothetical protein
VATKLGLPRLAEIGAGGAPDGHGHEVVGVHGLARPLLGDRARHDGLAHPGQSDEDQTRHD